MARLPCLVPAALVPSALPSLLAPAGGNRQHGPVIFCLTLWLLAIGSLVVFAAAWVVEQPLLGGTAMFVICAGSIAACRLAMKDQH